MAIYHLSAKVISRSAGRNAVNAAAYRRGAEMFDERTLTTFSYERKRDVVHSELSISEKAPVWARRLSELHAADPVKASEALWNRVEQNEKRKDAQLAREVEFALPHELTDEQRKVLVREFVTEQMVGRGMVADWSIHQGKNENHHAHVLMTMRPLTEEGFGAKKVPMLDPGTGVPLRDERGKIRYAFGDVWGTKEGLEQLREKWAEHQNFHLALHGHEVQVDHRSFKDRMVELTPTKHIGANAKSMAERGKPSERVRDHEAERLENAGKILERPEHVFELITNRQAVFSWHEVAREVGRYVDDPEAHQGVMARLAASPERVELAAEDRSEAGRVLELARYSTREMVKAERRMVETADRMAAYTSHGVELGRVVAAMIQRPQLSDEQRSAVLAMTAKGRIATVAGAAGSGKSTTLATARELWEAQGFRVRGAALAGKAADGLHESAGIESRTIHSLEYAWKSGRDLLTRRDVLVIDEAGMVGSRQLGRVLEQADRAGAKVVLVGDARQLQPIEAGAAFRAIAERVGVVEIETIRRQQEAWARQASQDFARGRVGAGLEAYRRRGQVELVGSREEAKAALARDWMEHRGQGSSIILAHTNQDVHDLNEAVRGARRLAGELGDDAPFSATKGAREFAVGDRLVFLENNRDLRVKNGTLGTVEETRQGELEVKLDSGERVRVREAEYANVDHGYAVTIHKAQGVTVDHAYVLASGGMDRHLAYVAMTRHRERATLYAGRDDFKDQEALEARLSRARPKETTLDFAERRGIDTPRSYVENARAWIERSRERVTEGLERAAQVLRDRMGLTKERELESQPLGPRDRLAESLQRAERTEEATRERLRAEQQRVLEEKARAAELARQKVREERRRQPEQKRTSHELREELGRLAREHHDAPAKLQQQLRGQFDATVRELKGREREVRAAPPREHPQAEAGQGTEAERERLAKLSSRELEREIAKIRPSPAYQVVDAMPAVAELIRAHGQAFSERAEALNKRHATESEVYRARRELAEWRETHKVRALLHDKGLAPVRAVTEMDAWIGTQQEKAQGYEFGEKAAVAAQGEAVKRLAELRAQLTPEVEKQQAPAIARVAELEALRDLARTREREKGRELEQDHELDMGR